VSRARQNSTGRLRLAPAAVGIAVGAALALGGCSAGQIAQTAGMEPAVNGGIGQAGQIAIRDVQLAYPTDGVYKARSSAVVIGYIVNDGQSDDALLQVTSPAGNVVVAGDKNLPAGTSLALDPKATPPTSSSSSSASSSATTTSAPTGSSSSSSSSSSATTTTGSSSSSSSSSSAATTTSSSVATTTSTPKPTIGKVAIVVTNIKDDLWSGKTIDLTFVFRNGGQATITVPIANPTTTRKPPAEETP
jgi:copper(I)-binding protein